MGHIWKPLVCSIVIAVAAVVVATAQPGPGPGPGRGPAMMGHGPGMMGHGHGMTGGQWNVGSYLDSLKAQLAITPQQDGAW